MLIKTKTRDLAYAIDKALCTAGSACEKASQDVYQKIISINHLSDRPHYLMIDKVKELNARANRG